MLSQFFTLFTQGPFQSVFMSLFRYLPVWMPFLMFGAFYQVWMRYIRTKYLHEQGTILLEFKIPKEMFKSPVAMEIVLAGLSQPSVGSYIDVFFKGRVRPWFSLELVSIGGQVHFFIWTQKKFKNFIESQVYSQFPTVEIHEVSDYALQTVYTPEEMKMWGMQLKLTKSDIIPIKSYIEYGMDKDPEEEFKIDPITPMLEYLGSIKQNEQVWIQILIQPHRKETLKDGRLQTKNDCKSDMKKEVEKIMKDSLVKPEKDKPPTLGGLSETQKDTINAMQRSVTKTPFDTMIRGIYIAPKDNFNPANITGLTSTFKQYGSGNLNGFAPSFTTGYEYPWQDFKGRREEKGKRKLFDAYRRRSFFNPPYKNFYGRPFVLTTEELATIYHFPGQVASTPTFSRISSKKAEAPSNLPL